jgi:hypothetical protein
LTVHFFEKKFDNTLLSEVWRGRSTKEVEAVEKATIYKVANLGCLEDLVKQAGKQLEALQSTMLQIQNFEFVLEATETKSPS